ncbi:transcriptional regulator [Vibrio mediterranei]|uniref:S24 family peptidase n=1 Tax=Vibrio mediterranei TaxID=689 RepID=UPI000D18099D|nr:helix-turn-helix transcriptional regulator [Vibrio mediterranei]PTC02016.1 transcriptional regulator [Vibrio mediterranei]
MNIETIGGRIRRKRKELGLTQVQVAKSVGVSPTSIVFWERDETVPTGKNLLGLCKKLHVEPDWLLTGKQPKSSSAVGSGNAELLGNMQAWDNKTPLGEDEVAIPLLSTEELSASNYRICEPEQAQEVRLRFAKSTLRSYNVSPSEVACVTVRGDSMEPVLPDGSTVGINFGDKELSDGKIYAIDHNGELYIKKLYRLPGGGMRIYSFNESEYPAREYSESQINEQRITIVGRIFWYSVLL